MFNRYAFDEDFMDAEIHAWLTRWKAKPLLSSVEEKWEAYAAIAKEVDERLPGMSEDEALEIVHREFHERYATSSELDRATKAIILAKIN
jgi:hypothetical protein